MAYKTDFDHIDKGGVIDVSSDNRIIPANDNGYVRVGGESPSVTISLWSDDLNQATNVTLKYGPDPDDKDNFGVAKDSSKDEIVLSVSGDGVRVTESYEFKPYDFFYFEVASGSTGSIEYRINAN